MKKAVLVVAVAVLCFTAGSAMAGKCDTYQWKPCYQESAGSGDLANLCKYYQWKFHRCYEAPVVKAAPAPAPERMVLEGVKFDTGSARIKPESYSVLDKNVANLSKKGNTSITIEGFTDNVGNPQSNLKLSSARAAAVKDYLVTKGISADRIKTHGFGDANPIADNKTPDGRAQNRRIEIETH